MRAIEEHSLCANKIDCGYSEKLGAQAADQILAAKVRPDAILCASDIIAYGLIGRMREKNEDYLMSLGIAGFDNIAFNSYQRPSLTSVAVNYKEMAETTIEALLMDESDSEFIISTKLFARDSSLPKSSKSV